jgi:penicillin-binding protein 1A
MPLSAALVAVDPGTGAVRAVVGGPDYGRSQFNTALSGTGRQPGSAFKPFTLVAALRNGYSPNDVVDGSTPCTIPNPLGTPDPWTPANFDGEGFGPINLIDATSHSVNCAYARLALSVGLPAVTAAAHDLGITAPLATVPSTTLGTSTVTPLQMASAYATLAANGAYRTPHLVAEIDGPFGQALFTTQAVTRQSISADVAAATTQVLTHVITDGTGTAAALPGHPAAGKTGTSENYQDAWFVGYTPQLATAVWMGDPAGEVPMRGVGGINVVGGSYPARIWNTFMAGALASQPAIAFPTPASTPPPVVLRQGQPRTAAPDQQHPSPPQTQTTTWCSASCSP